MQLITNFNKWNDTSILGKLDLTLEQFNVQTIDNSNMKVTDFWNKIGAFSLKAFGLLVLSYCMFFILIYGSIFLNIDLGDSVYTGVFFVAFLFTIRYIFQIVKYIITSPKYVVRDQNLFLFKSILKRNIAKIETKNFNAEAEQSILRKNGSSYRIIRNSDSSFDYAFIIENETDIKFFQ